MPKLGWLPWSAEHMTTIRTQKEQMVLEPINIGRRPALSMNLTPKIVPCSQVSLAHIIRCHIVS